jgi:CubicO group peptidase (beta-lactamase class C family)
MKRLSLCITLLALTCNFGAHAQQEDNYDYFTDNRTVIRTGVQAVLMCNGLFTGGRTLEQVFGQELAYLTEPRFSGANGSVDDVTYEIDHDRKAVAVTEPDNGQTIRAAFREGIGCVVMAPDQTFDDIDSLPMLDLPYPDFDPATTPWPNGDLVAKKPLPANVDAQALQAASDWAFSGDTPGFVTLSLLVVHNGDIIHERYANGVDMMTRTRTWSTAKSIAVTLPRNAITLRHVLNMSSGLYPVDSSSMEYATGSGLSYWVGASSIHGMRNRGLVREPGTFWDYENYDTLLAVYAMKQALGSDKAYQEFPRRALLDKIGMRNTLVGADRFHDFILSSLQNGVWDGERLLSEEWIEFVRTPAPATRERGNFYGGQWWLPPDDRSDVPADAYSTSGNRGQYVIVVPTHDLVIVRRGLDYGRPRIITRWDIAREVLKAIQPEQAIANEALARRKPPQ